MTSGPITSWQIGEEIMGIVRDVIFEGSKITADFECSRVIKRHLLLGRKAMTNLDSILKSRDITLLTNVCLVKAMVFPVVMYGCGNKGNSERLYFGASKITEDGDCSHEIKMLAPWKKTYEQPRQHIKKQRYHFTDKGRSSQSYDFFRSHVWM